MFGFSILTWILAFSLFIITLIFLFYRKVYFVAFVAVNWTFFVALTFAIMALFFGTAYEKGIGLIFDQTDLSNQLKQVDSVVTDVGRTSENSIGKIKEIFSDDKADSDFESDVYGQFISFIATLIRAITFIFALVIMLILTYVRYAFSGIYEAVKVADKLDDLEDRVKHVENIFSIKKREEEQLLSQVNQS